MVDYINNPIDLRRRLADYAYHPDTPAELAEKLKTIPGVDADVLSEAPEVLYAFFDVLSEQGRTALAQLADYGVRQNWSSLNAGGRWERIRDAARRELGEEVEADPAGDPAPQVTRRADGIDWRDPPAEEG
jgi:hypothetical protein